jgi:hypothetical protein
MTLRDELYLRETIKRFNEQGIICVDSDEGRKTSIKVIGATMEMLGFRKIDYKIKFERVVQSDGRVMDEISLDTAW